jgi:hypothetical protein
MSGRLEVRMCGSAQLRQLPPIHWAPHSHRPALKNVGVNHGRRDVSMAQQFLYRSDVVPILQQMGGERVPEGVASRALGDPGPPYCVPDGSLDRRLVQMMAL